MLDLIFAIAYYLALMFGAVTFGYVVLSFSLPMFSQFEKEERLGYSTIAGIALVLLAIVLDAIVFGFENAVRAKGFFPLWLLVLACAVILSTNAYSIVLKKPLLVMQRQVVSDSNVDEIKKQIELIVQKELGEQKPARPSISGGAPPWVARNEMAKKREEEKLMPPVKQMSGKAIIDSIAQNAGEEGIEQPIIESDFGQKPRSSAQLQSSKETLSNNELQSSKETLSNNELQSSKETQQSKSAQSVKPVASSNKEKQIKLVEQKELEEENS